MLLRSQPRSINLLAGIIPTNTPSRLIYHAAVTNPAPLIAGRPGGSDFGIATRRVARPPLKQRQAIIMGEQLTEREQEVAALFVDDLQASQRDCPALC